MTQTIYAENHRREPNYSFPYQKQQRTSGAFIVTKDGGEKPTLDKSDLEKLRAAVEKQLRVAATAD